MKLSGLQSGSWNERTIIILLVSIIAWGVFPFLLIWILGKKDIPENYSNRTLQLLINTTQNLK